MGKGYGARYNSLLGASVELFRSLGAEQVDWNKDTVLAYNAAQAITPLGGAAVEGWNLADNWLGDACTALLRNCQILDFRPRPSYTRQSRKLFFDRSAATHPLQ